MPINDVRCRRHALTRRPRRWVAASSASMLAAMVLCAPASATTHDYCNWDGSYCANAANTTYFAAGTNLLTQNHALLVYLPTTPTIYCGAHAADGSQYAGYAAGNPACDHTYSGALPLKADEYVSVAATTHGTITY